MIAFADPERQARGAPFAQQLMRLLAVAVERGPGQPPTPCGKYNTCISISYALRWYPHVNVQRASGGEADREKGVVTGARCQARLGSWPTGGCGPTLSVWRRMQRWGACPCLRHDSS
jgi:hypothetical protein